MKPTLIKLPPDSEAEDPHKLKNPNGEVIFDWNGRFIYILHIEPKKPNQGTARKLLEELYRLGANGTISLGTIVAHRMAAEGFLRIQKRLCKKYNVTPGHFRMDPSDEPVCEKA